MRKRFCRKLPFALVLAALTYVGPSTIRAQTQQPSDTTAAQQASVDRFLDAHPELAEQVHKNPALINNEEFVEKHPALQQYLQQHPEVREEFKENPSAFMQQEQRFEQQEENGDGRRLGSLDRFLDAHPELAEQVRKNPSLINNEEFVEKHPALQQYLQQHPGVREEFRENPNAFMRAEDQFDRREGADRDEREGQIRSADRFLDSHPELAEQVRKNPSLINNEEFVEKHPALQQYLQEHPEVREEFRENPNAFMRQEQRFDQRGDTFARGERGESGGFGEFLQQHTGIAHELSKNPALVNNSQYVAKHPELREFLTAHPGVAAELKENPRAFVDASGSGFGTPKSPDVTAGTKHK